ncbi:hypothetical protein BDZ94DRAFT_1297108 [Collybia nuda]|uniref:Zn(2)-C6 fungal-type domain-containing protein n=1 Tax=Collybia nuda TaxID=64659 RepID=A0A9P5Y986_9AGAR|nr:hypothetical protein BDZ94DRAFT_1297108 [Collybia nuda]
MPPYKTESTLRRGTACLSCRKRKLKCDGTRPVCRQCDKMNRGHSCAYDDKQQKSRTQLLKEQLAMLEKRLQELESNPSGSRSSPSTSFQLDMESYNFDSFDGTPSVSPFANGSLQLQDVGSSSSSSSSSSSPSMYTSALFPPGTGGLEGFDSDLSFYNYSNATSDTNEDQVHMSSLPPASKKHLLDIFTAHKHQCWFYGSMERFYQEGHAQSYAEEPHPALTNAIFLLSCHFSQMPCYSDMEPGFFTHTLHEINAALDTSDRLVDIVQASSLLAVYLYTNHRVLEGYRHAFSAIRLAVGLGLHQIRPLDISAALGYPQQSSLIPLPIPQNQTELTDRISAFWQVFMVDRCWSVVNGLPLALPDKENSQTRILTPWPIGFDEFDWEDHTAKGPIQMLFQGVSEFPTAMCIPALKAKAAALYELTSRLKADKSEWTDYCFAESALQRFSSTLPSQSDRAGRTSPILDHDYFAIQTMTYTSFIHLQQGLLFDERAFKAANSIIRLIRQLSEADYQYIDPIMGACWHTASKIFTRVLTNIDKMNSYTRDITNIIHCYESFGRVFGSIQYVSMISLQDLTLNVIFPSGDLALKLELASNHSRLIL